MTSNQKTTLMFKRCPMCGTMWDSRGTFLADPDVAVVGYQVNFRDLVAGIFLFNHSCGDTFALHVSVFRDLYKGPVFNERATGTSECPGHCLRQDDLDPCPAHCECNFVREILQIIKTWPKSG